MQTDKCEGCGGQFAAKSKVVKETNCNDCLMAKHFEVSNSISNRIRTRMETNIIIF